MFVKQGCYISPKYLKGVKSYVYLSYYIENTHFVVFVLILELRVINLYNLNEHLSYNEKKTDQKVWVG